jgi:MerR family transcriptional regulator, redox-sensitive transcriptional activator SoxR
MVGVLCAGSQNRSVAIVVVKVDLMSTPDPEPGHAAPLLTIGSLAARTGKRPSSIRYYEQIGLLPEPLRLRGRRVYDTQTVQTLAVIETGQRAGLSLDEIKSLLSASTDDRQAIEMLRELAARKLPEIAELIERSELVRGWLECAARCECPNLAECPLFEDPASLPREAGERDRRPRPNSR